MEDTLQKSKASLKTELLAELQRQKVIVSEATSTISDKQEKGNWRSEAWHDTPFLLASYRRANWAITMEVNNLAAIDEGIAKSKVFQRVEQYSSILEKILVENVDQEFMMRDRSKTLERARSLSLSLLLLQDMHTALERLRCYPQLGEAYYKILYYSYFSDLTGAAVINRRSPGYRTVMQYAAREQDTIDFDERRFYQLRNAAMELYDTLLWGLTSRETMTEFMTMLQNMLF